MILVAPTAFKGTIGAAEAARELARGAREAAPLEEIVELPVSDGGPGLIDAIRALRAHEVRSVRVQDPLGRPVDARILLAELEHGSSAIVESADACGMHLLARAELDPMRASSRGAGQLIDAAARLADTVVVGLGGSATVDGGVGMASALGWRFIDAAGRDLEPGGAALRRLERIHAPSARSAPRVVALADVASPLLGALGAARVFGPQKGASVADVELLEEGLSRLAEVVRRDVGIDVAARPGAGAAGGLGAACVAFLDAELVRGSDWLLRAVGFDALLARASLVVTGEGSWDAQSSMGKVTGVVVARADRAGVPVLLVAGRTTGESAGGMTVAAGNGNEALQPYDLRRLAARAIADMSLRFPGAERGVAPIDHATGAIRTDEVTIGPHLLLADARAWPAFLAEKSANEERGWLDVRLRDQMIGGFPFTVVLRFEDSGLRSVELMHADPRFGTTWEDWSEEKQKSLRRWHDDWLWTVARVDWRAMAFPWGRIDSGYDSKGGFSHIVVAYGSNDDHR